MNFILYTRYAAWNLCNLFFFHQSFLYKMLLLKYGSHDIEVELGKKWNQVIADPCWRMMLLVNYRGKLGESIS